ncbi:halocyanin domain-containing protein [Halomicrobium sp. HM KBTZ05]|uniref:halocyanin domain-containing protein n=1 Tax=Halomicrobium sp. HM KBTZ05 TaxID=3242663 RepID=UPI003555D202
MRRSLSRRQLLQGVSFASIPALAARLGSARSGSPATTSPPTTTATPSSTDAPVDDLDAWLADANGYGGQFRNVGYDDLVEVLVGHPIEGDGYAFDPPAVTVTPGTTVVWRWFDHGGPHNVVAVDGSFDSGDATDRPNETYSHHFETTGEYPYVSEPRRDDGLKGVIRVRKAPESGYPDLDHWLIYVDGWDGTLADRTGLDTVTVTVGSPGNGGNFAFDPLALKCSTGTTVAFEWTGDGGAHNIGFQGDIEKSDIYSESGRHFEVTFDEPGVYPYACYPHEAIGQRGGIVVEE